MTEGVTEKLEVLVAWLDAMRRRDLATVRELLHPDVTWHGVPAGAVCRNRAEVLEMLSGALDSPNVDAMELVGGRDGAILGMRSPDFDQIEGVLAGQLFNVFRIQGGRIASVRDFARHDEALRAARADPPGWS